MRRPAPSWLAGLVLALFLIASLPLNAGQAAPAPSSFAARQILVKWVAEPPAWAGDVASRMGARREPLLPRLGTELWHVPAGQEQALARELSGLPGVAYAAPNVLVHAAGVVRPPAAHGLLIGSGAAGALALADLAPLVPDDPYYPQQWDMDLIRAPEAWALSTGSAQASIAVIDSGVNYNLPDFAGRVVLGPDLADGDEDPMDEDGHGTLVAGLATAAGNDGYGIAGVSWQSTLLVVRVLDRTGNGTCSDAAQGVAWAADHNARVINLSLTANEPCPALADAVAYAQGRGSLVVASAGNRGVGGAPAGSLATLPGVIAVAASTRQDSVAAYSSRGDFVDLAAPGDEVTGVGAQGELESGRGTSFAAPHVAGLAALLLARFPSLDAAGVETVLRATAVDLGAPGWDELSGWGRIDAAAALSSLAFADVLPGSWYYPAVMTLAQAGAAAGYPDGSFRPEAALTRAEWVALLGEAAGLSPLPAGEGPFGDVPAGHWAASWVQAAYAAGWVSGYPDGSFRPDAPVTRAEATAVLDKAWGLAPAAVEALSFNDEAGSWAAGWVEAARAAGLVSGYPDGSFRPDASITRAEAAALAAKSLSLRTQP